MLEFLDRLRAKPLKERKRIALGSTVSIFAVIMLVWWTTFTSPLSDERVKATDNVATPINVMGGFFGQIKDGAKALPVQIKEYMENVATGTGKGGLDANGSVSASDLLATTTHTVTLSSSTTPPAPVPPPAKPVPAMESERTVTPPQPAPTPKQTTPPSSASIVTPEPPSPPAHLIPTRPTKIAPSNG